jgi:hypothetical protein
MQSPKLLLLTAQRREKVATMKRGDIVNGTWTISREEREKGTGDSLQLPAPGPACRVERSERQGAGQPQAENGQPQGRLEIPQAGLRVLAMRFPSLAQESRIMRRVSVLAEPLCKRERRGLTLVALLHRRGCRSTPLVRAPVSSCLVF